MYKKVPTWKEYFAAHPELADVVEQHFIIRRMLRPSRYPSWGFITDDFRLSVDMPEGFEEAVISHGKSKTWVIFTIGVHKGKPKVGCRIYEDRDKGADLPWCTIACFDTWVALDDATKNNAAQDDDSNSEAHTPTVDSASINNFVAKQRSLSRQKTSRRAKKTGSD